MNIFYLERIDENDWNICKAPSLAGYISVYAYGWANAIEEAYRQLAYADVVVIPMPDEWSKE